MENLRSFQSTIEMGIDTENKSARQQIGVNDATSNNNNNTSSSNNNGSTMVKFKGESVKERRLYKAESTPPLLFTFFFGLQQVMVSVSVLVSIPFLISDEVCPGQDLNALRVRLISSTFVVCGLATILQTSFGLRLALLQGVAFAYIPSVRAFMQLPEFRCNATIHDVVPPEEYENKMALLQGTLLASSCITMLIGATGLVGRMTKFIGPLTVAALMMLLMLSSVQLCVERMEKHWISLVALLVLFATVLYLPRLQVPIPGFVGGNFKVVHFNLFGQYPYLITISISWFLCWLLTVFDLVPADGPARTDKITTVTAINNSPWFKLPIFGQFGAPKFNFGLFMGYLVSAQTTLFEAIGNYHAVARVSEERPPPSHAINRAVLSEGLGCFISGLIGPGVGITTHAENVGVVGITRVASRVTMVVGGITLILFGVCTKLGAVLSSIPDPLVGVVLSSSMAMVGGVAFANCQQVDMAKTRNVAIIGFSVMMGMCVPTFYQRNPGLVNTGVDALDQILRVLLSLPMFVGAFSACVLDNTVSGATRSERGLRERGMPYDLDSDGRDVYAFPTPVMKFMGRHAFFEYFPFLPREKKPMSSAATLNREIDESFNC